MRLLCDAMLGRLAAWLRLLGHDVAYQQGIADDALLAQALAEHRLLLTRDEALAARAPPGVAHLVLPMEPEVQLRAVAHAFPAVVGEAAPLTRCSACNSSLQVLPKAQAEGRVPPAVWASQEAYWTCPRCGRVYWRGTHAARIAATLQALAIEGKRAERGP
jgi:uncharacterized protein